MPLARADTRRHLQCRQVSSKRDPAPSRLEARAASRQSVIWQSDVAEESPAWHALAATDHFVVKVDLTVTDAETMTKLASIAWA